MGSGRFSTGSVDSFNLCSLPFSLLWICRPVLRLPVPVIYVYGRSFSTFFVYNFALLVSVSCLQFVNELFTFVSVFLEYL